jgi:hypothetical protein
VIPRIPVDLAIERWLREYQAIWNLIQMMDESAAEDDPLYDDLTTVMDLRQAGAVAMSERGINLVERRRTQRSSGWHPSSLHNLFCKIFRPFKPRRGFVRSEYCDSAGAKSIGNSGNERCLWTDDDQIETLFNRVVGDDPTVGDIHRNDIDDARYSGVPRRGHNLVQSVVAQQRVDDGVLSRTRAKNENLHTQNPTFTPASVNACLFLESRPLLEKQRCSRWLQGAITARLWQRRSAGFCKS